MLAKRGIPAADLAQNLSCLRDALQQQLPQERSSIACAYIESALSQLPLLRSTTPTLISDQAPLADLTKSYLEALLSGERQVASHLILQAVERGVSIQEIYLHVFQSTQYELGRLWQMNQLSVAQEHYCTAATQLIMSQLYTHIFATEKRGWSLVATCVAGDLHEIGVRMVADFFEMAGWDTYYLGANTPSDSVVQTIGQQKPQILAISATMSFHLQAVAELIKMVRSTEEGKAVKIMVGGYPFNLAQGLWQGVGADAGARDAAEAIAVAETLVSLEVV